MAGIPINPKQRAEDRNNVRLYKDRSLVTSVVLNWKRWKNNLIEIEKTIKIRLTFKTALLFLF